MKYLLEVFLKYFDFLYLNPLNRITNSSTSGMSTINAQLVITGEPLSWSITNDRGQILVAMAPTSQVAPENWFRLSIVRRHLDGTQATGPLSVEALEWLKSNVSRVEGLFADATSTRASCKDLIALENAVADELFGPSDRSP